MDIMTGDIQMINNRIKTSLIRSSEELKARPNKTGINFMIFILIFLKNCLQFDAKHNFWLKTGPNPADINRFCSCTGNIFTCVAGTWDGGLCFVFLGKIIIFVLKYYLI